MLQQNNMRLPRRALARYSLAAAASLCLLSILNYLRLRYSQTDLFPDNMRRPFQWDMVEPSKDNRCRNTVQGVRLVTDDRGYTCRLENVDANNCCLPSNTTSQYSCRGCMQQNICCNTYEYCVSCCLRPEELGYLKQMLANARSLLFTMVENTFDLCMAACRTSSRSVVHENTYIDNQYKFCVKGPQVFESASTPEQP